WRHGISGDLPLVLVRIRPEDDLLLVRQLLTAHAYWRGKGLSVDVVLLNESPASYRDDLHDTLMGLVPASEARDRLGRAGGVVGRRIDHFARGDLEVLLTVARVVLSTARGSLADQVWAMERPAALPAPFRARRQVGVPASAGLRRPQPPEGGAPKPELL